MTINVAETALLSQLHLKFALKEKCLLMHKVVLSDLSGYKL